MTRRQFARLAAAWPWLAAEPKRSRVTVQVLRLLKPTQVIISPAGNSPVVVTANLASRTLWPGHSLKLSMGDAPFTTAARLALQEAAFRITLPGGFARDYLGRLSAERNADGMLRLIVEMSVETAVRSIVGAELPTHGAAPGALAAQAVVARSFLIASPPRHEHSDFCDTTHCQFLRSPAKQGSAVFAAAEQTRGLVLKSEGKPFPALYSAACGGETEQREQGGYLYQRVRCDVCTSTKTPRSGHGLGLCQNAALTLGRQGWPWLRILEKYYPGATV